MDFKGRSYLNLDEELFCTKLVDHNWEAFYTIPDIDVAWNYLLEIVENDIEELCPLKSFHIKNKKDPWVTNEILEAIRDKDTLLWRAKHTNKPEDWEQAKRSRNRVNIDIKNLKADFIKENLEEHQNDAKKFWKDVQNVLPSKNKTSVRRYTLKNDDGELLFDPIKASTFINSFFLRK